MANNFRPIALHPPLPDGFDDLIMVPRPRRQQTRLDALLRIFGQNNPPERARQLAEITIADEEAETAGVDRVLADRAAADRARAAVDRAIAAGDRARARQATIDRESSGESKGYEPEDIRREEQMGGSKRRRKRRRSTRRRRTIRRRASRRRRK